jgi:ankyrin repeat protein
MMFQTARTLQLCSSFLISVISGSTALIESSCWGHLELTRFLVESGANVEAKDNKYYTP